MHHLIPFGLHEETKQLVDVGSVSRGNKCNCICPSCKTPLIARQGSSKEWHFAHRSRGVHKKTANECEYSFAVSIRLMIRQLSEDSLVLKTPEFFSEIALPSDTPFEYRTTQVRIAKEQTLTFQQIEVGKEFSGVEVDLVGYMNNGYLLIIYITYKGRIIPHEFKYMDSKTCGVIELNLQELFALFRKEKRGQYKKVLKHYLEKEVDGKKWIYHPREEKEREKAQLRYEEAKKHKSLPKPTFAKSHQKYIKDQTLPKLQSYKCLNCESHWTGVSNYCKNCKSPLYSTTA